MNIPGNPAVFPAELPLVADIPPDASELNVPIEALADRTAYLKALVDASKCVPVELDFTANGTFTPPANALPWCLYHGWGGGGAGGQGGLSVVSSANVFSAGGGGGAGAVAKSGLAPIYPGESHAVAIGAGGVGVDGLLGFGLWGADTTLVRVSTTTTLLRLSGAGGGHSPTLETVPIAVADPQNYFKNVRGGHSTRMLNSASGVLLEVATAQRGSSTGTHVDPTDRLNTSPQAGGIGVVSPWPKASPVHYQGTYGCPGSSSPEGFDGGDGGTPGTHASAGGGGHYAGGGAGGGGGAGPGGVGGRGGDGGDGASSGVAESGSAGVSAAANTGAGGGGGGAAGWGTTAGAVAGAPGNGGSGRLKIIYFIPMQVP